MEHEIVLTHFNEDDAWASIVEYHRSRNITWRYIELQKVFARMDATAVDYVFVFVVTS